MLLCGRVRTHADDARSNLPTRKINNQVIAGLNLASNPFRNRTLPWTTAVVVSLVSLLALVYVATEGRRARAEADTAEASVTRMRAEKKAIEDQAAAIKQEMPVDQRDVLDAAHALVDRKTFSWSQLFADLEDVTPTDVRVQRISVRDVAQRGGEMRAELEMTVAGKRPENVTGMMTEMSKLGAFAATPITENFKSGRSESVYEWTLRVGYVQRVKRSGEGSGTERAGVASMPGGGRAEARQ